MYKNEKQKINRKKDLMPASFTSWQKPYCQEPGGVGHVSAGWYFGPALTLAL
jgi:hypothetical protein